MSQNAAIFMGNRRALVEYAAGLVGSRSLAEDLVQEAWLRFDNASEKQFVREKIAEQLERRLPTSGPIVRSKSVGPHVVALIGPTGGMLLYARGGDLLLWGTCLAFGLSAAMLHMSSARELAARLGGRGAPA